MNTKTITTPRLILRKFTQGDIAALHEIYSDEEVNKFLPMFPFETLAHAQEFYETQLVAKYAAQKGCNYAICLKEDNYPVGYVNVAANDSHDLGYGLRKEFWHKGIVSEAAGAVIAQLKEGGVPFITATHDVNNPRSGAVMQRIGMEYKYSYEEQWQPKDFLVTFRMYQLNLAQPASGVYEKYWNAATVRFVEEGI